MKPDTLTRRVLLRWLAMALGIGTIGTLTQRGECARNARCGDCPLLANCALPPATTRKNHGR